MYDGNRTDQALPRGLTASPDGQSAKSGSFLGAGFLGAPPISLKGDREIGR